MKKILTLVVLTLVTGNYAGAQVSNPRHPAEWEEIGAVIMEGDYFRSFPTLYEEGLQPYLKVAQACIDEGVDFYLIDPDTSYLFPKKHNWDTCFVNRGIVSPRIHIINVNNADNYERLTWARDHNPFSIYKNGVDTLFLSNSLLRNPYTTMFAKAMNLPQGKLIPNFRFGNNYYYWDGGNFLTDGHGTFNIANVFEDTGLVNPATTPFSDYFGIKKTLNVRGIGVHVDYWLKLINEETFVVSYVPQSNYGFSMDPDTELQKKIDEGIQSIVTNLSSVFGRSFQFIRIQNAPTFNDAGINTAYLTEVASYTNSLILNKSVLVPQYLTEPTDSLALKAYREAMPGYKVIGVNTRSYAAGGGALHCLTREIYSRYPLYMKHAWYRGTIDNRSDYPVMVEAKSVKGIRDVKLYWKPGAGSFREITMLPGAGNTYTTHIPGQPDGTKIEYYISATDMDSKTISKPYVAPGGYYQFVVKNGTSGLGGTETDAAEIRLYPGADRDCIRIKTALHDGDYAITIHAVTGRLLKKIAVGNLNTELNISGLPAGVYILTVTDNKTMWKKNLKFNKLN